MPAYRVPLAGPYTSRISAVNASDSSSGYVGVGIVGLMVVGKTTQATDKDARYVNCFAHGVSDSVAGRKTWYLVKRPGFGTQNTPAAGKKGYQILVWTGSGTGTSVISAFDNPSTVYIDNTGVGAISGKCTGITETTVGTTPTFLVTSDDNTAWYYDAGVGVMTKITDVDFPSNAGFTITGTFANLKGFACIATTDGKIWASDLNSVTGWTPNSFDTANAYPDAGVGLLRAGDYILYLNTQSCELWFNAGLSPFPLARVSSKTIKVGAVSADAIGEISDTKFWAGSAPEGGLSVFQYDSSVGRISTPEIDAALILAGASNISISTLRLYGLSFVLVKAGPLTYVYCVEEKLWHEWSSTTPLWTKCAAVSRGGTMVNYAVSNVDTSGKVFLMNHASLVFTDNGTTYTARLQTPPQDSGTDRKKFYEDLSIVADTESSASTLTISASDDDFASYKVLGTVDLSAARPLKVTRLGSARQRSWVLTHSAATPMRLRVAEGNLTVGAS